MTNDGRYALARAMRGRLRAVGPFVAVGAAIFSIGVLGVTSWEEQLEMNRAALGGHDPVAYFVNEEPRLGVPAHGAEVAGNRYLFMSAENRAAFLADPEKFVPQFGGLDAYGLRMGERRPGNPKIFRVVGGRLFLFGDADSIAAWDQDYIHNTRVAELIFSRLSYLAPQ